MLDTLLVNVETIFSANHLTGSKHSAFSTNHLANIDKTKQNYNLEQQKNPTTTQENYQHMHKLQQMKQKPGLEELLCHLVGKQIGSISQLSRL